MYFSPNAWLAVFHQVASRFRRQSDARQISDRREVDVGAMVLVEVVVQTDERVADSRQNSSGNRIVEAMVLADQRMEIFRKFFVDENNFAVLRQFANETEKNKSLIIKRRTVMSLGN